MATTARFAEIANLAGEPARAAMLTTLMDGRALTASELARCAGVTPQTASGHLLRLASAGLLAVEQQGRHRYHRLASREVASVLEGIMQVAGSQVVGGAAPRIVRTGPRDDALRAARTCYDHLAGRLGVAIADSLVARGYVRLDQDAGTLTEAGAAHLGEVVGLESAREGPRSARSRNRPFCRPCLDWSERRAHLAGVVGAAICAHALAHGWVRRLDGSRALRVTPHGRQQFRAHLGVDAS